MKKTIITVVGKDCVGIIAKVCTYLAENKVNILDISQKLMQNLFTMIALVDMEKSELTLDELTAELEKVGEELNVAIRVLPEESFEV